MNKNITAHMVVKNEDRFIWYAITSVLPFVTEFIIFDTGSTDCTVDIIKSFRDKRIIFKEKGIVDENELTALRQKQIEMTKTEWIWIVDGDEVYPRKTAEKIISIVAQNKPLGGIIVHRYDLLGDVYHYQSEDVGAYNQFGKTGHYVLRLINRKAIDGLQVVGNYPNEYYADSSGKSIKSYGKNKFAYVEERIFHAMYLERSSNVKNVSSILNRKSRKIELGRKIPREDLPEVFFQKRPISV